MSQSTLLAVACLVTLTLVPTATAGYPSCEAVTEQDDAPYYVVSGNLQVSLWEETNDVPGLQRSSCTDAGGRTVERDGHVVTVSGNDVPRCFYLVDRLVCIL